MAAFSFAQDRTLRIPRISRAPTLEDFAAGASLEEMARITGFRQRQPDDGAPVSRKTTAYLGYDDKNIYAVFVCQEQAGKVRARLNKREDIFNDDVVGIFLDTFRDRQHTFEFLVNPLGIQADGIETEGQGDDFSFDTLWFSNGRITPEGYTVLMSIPFRSLRFKNRDVQTWGIALVRIIPDNNETSFWPFITQKVEGFSQQLATLQGLENISPGRNLQFIPYGLLSRSRFLDRPDGGIPAFRKQTDFRGGLDSKIVLRDALTLDIALNPDFSQVESDDPQVTVNQRFEVFFPEKRPFFIENAAYFQTPENLFFSRRIADPEYGARLTGKAGRWALGVLGIDDRAPGQSLSLTDPAFGGRAAIGVVRVQREFGEQSTIGILATSRDFGSSSNRLISFDTRLKLNPNWVFTAQAVHSESRDFDTGHRVGSLYYAEISENGLHSNYSGRYRDRSPNFRSDLGFIPRVDIRQFEQNYQYRWRPKNRVVASHGPFVSGLGNWDHQGRPEDWSVNPGYFVEFKRQTYFVVGQTETFERFQDVKFRRHSSDVFLASDRFKKIGLQAMYSTGTRVNYSPNVNLLPFLANGSEANARITWRPSPRIKLEENYFYTHLTERLGGPAVFNNHILRSRLNYQFTRELSLRLILDYNAVLPNPDLVNLDRSKRITGDVLITYLIHPGTAFYVGYTDRRENVLLAPGETSLARIGFPSTVTGRQFFAKISYLFRF
ncbi:MAG: carbohydrate binding family 9 domain-containing protein [Acidobacteriota bacterium]|nr:carbohydrate binding family 9 domain-containing protein [Acidobacteriota bacterium]